MDRNHNFESMKVEDLKKYLRQCGAKVSGNKPELLERAKAYFLRAQNDKEESEQQQVVNNSGNDNLLDLEEKRCLTFLDFKIFATETHMLSVSCRSGNSCAGIVDWGAAARKGACFTFYIFEKI